MMTMMASTLTINEAKDGRRLARVYELVLWAARRARENGPNGQEDDGKGQELVVEMPSHAPVG